jgi:DNA-binding GntR family transcriptional regulator
MATDPSAPQLVGRSMLRDQIREVLLERILNGGYAPGERIIESQVAREFGISHAPVREGLRELELLRMVVSEPFRGVRVREITARELSEIYPVRAALEEVAARGAAKVFVADASPLAAELEAMLEAADRQDLHALVSHDVDFHRLIVEASGNRTLLQVWRSLRIEARTMITVIKNVDDAHQVAESHRPVLEALRTGDPQRAGRSLRRHVESFGRWVPRDPAA